MIYSLLFICVLSKYPCVKWQYVKSTAGHRKTNLFRSKQDPLNGSLVV